VTDTSTAETHDRYAATVVEVLGTPWPWMSGHTSLGPDDVDVTPSRLHPCFHGSVDWHSSVHVQWSAARLLAEDPTRTALRDVLDDRLTVPHAEVEAAYLRERPSYERPYGWAWAAMLAAECTGTPWERATRVVADAVADNLLGWLPRLAYPVRHGVHSNTAFALALTHEAYAVLGRPDVVAAVEDRARAWFAADRDAPTTWEPSGSDFLSPALTEAALLRRVLGEDFPAWLDGFLPRLGEEGDRLLEVPEVLDPSDGHAVHLHGLALSRAWQLRQLAAFLPEHRAARVLAAADAQEASALPAVTEGHVMSTHWLVSFALLAQGPRT
jgi:hypothetical protein